MVTVAHGSGIEWDDRGRLRARVFLSCGQRRDSDEIEIARRIGQRLDADGYDVYVATEQQTLKGFKEVIFQALADSEYFVFVDFKRERIGETGDYRGSLFSHQELAVAAYLDLQVAAFREVGVRERDGLIGFMQANAIEFTDRETLPNMIAGSIRERGWHSDWRRQLVLGRDPGEYVQHATQSGESRRFFHIAVQNLDPIRAARNCLVYLTACEPEESWPDPLWDTIELKWEGFGLPNATVLPRSRRTFDAVHCFVKDPGTPLFHTFAESRRFFPPIIAGGEYRLTFSVYSDNFPPASASFLLTAADQLEDWRLVLDRPVT